MLSNNGGALLEADVNMPPALGQNCGQWFAAYTRSRHEKRVALQCERIGITQFLPLYVLHRTWKNRVSLDLHLPFFPNYIFARLSPGEHVSLLKLPGVLSIVRNAAGYVPIPAGEIEALKHFVSRKTAAPHAFVKSGDKVRLHRGPLKGLSGVVLRKNNGLRFVVTLDLIGRSVAVDLDANDFEVLDARSPHLAETREISA